jgi:hypothetical protein
VTIKQLACESWGFFFCFWLTNCSTICWWTSIYSCCLLQCVFMLLPLGVLHFESCCATMHFLSPTKPVRNLTNCIGSSDSGKLRTEVWDLKSSLKWPRAICYGLELFMYLNSSISHGLFQAHGTTFTLSPLVLCLSKTFTLCLRYGPTNCLPNLGEVSLSYVSRPTFLNLEFTRML